ncbi:MAG: GIY-YIG nuclease family protein [Deltaproteobacteria bacterium]|nr:GIY-YIG nuclease family protein [Deltaproteobacteria bacterium]
MKYVYLIQSISNPNQKYIGTTSDVKKRILAHNAGQSPHTSKYKPWKLVFYFAFSNTEKAMEFEKYLKTGSGRAFANRHFWS